ncbi:MAG: PAS domain-containing sensor histidine kinase [Propionibacteriales bacterium]|nr:PAS domain-containing sensor histidine kinase [Propionibacteriales bacterium]
MPFRDGADGYESDALHARRLHVLFNHLPALIGYWDRDLRNVIANSAYLEWFGRTPEEMHGMHIRDVLGEAVYTLNLPHITAALAGNEQLFERTLVDTAGRIRHTQASYVPDVVDGEVCGFYALVTDVTPRVEAQRSMDEAQRLAELGSWSLETSSDTAQWSDELYRLFGTEPDAFVPTVAGLLERIDPRDRERVERQIDQARRDGEDYSLTYRILRADGRVREVRSQGHPHRGPDGQVVRLTGTLQDVTATNTASRELSRVNNELRKANQLSADVLAMLGHDVRAPLAVVLGYLEELTENWEKSTEDQLRDHAQRARRGAERLRGLVDDILAMATVDSGEIVTRPVELSLRDQVEMVLENLGAVAGVTVTGDADAFADVFHVRQVLTNLITNALRYGLPPIAVHLGSTGSNCATVTISDHGPGIAPDRVPTLFDRFVNGGTVGTNGPRLGVSTGFGLYIAAGLAEANDGALSYEPGSTGATFRLTLPTQRATGG